MQMSRGSFCGVLRTGMGSKLRAFSAETNQAILTRGDPDPETVTLIPITERNAGTRWRGRTLDPGTLVIKGYESGYHNQTSRDTRVDGLIVPSRLIDLTSSVLTGRTAELDWTGWQVLRPSPAALARFRAGLKAIMTSPVHPPMAPSLSKHEEACLRSLADILLEGSNKAPVLRQNARARLVRNATAYLHDRIGERVTALDICAHFEVSDRLLRLAFKESYGMGPLTYLRVARLHAVRAALLQARGRDVSVAEVLGRFSVTRPAAFAGEYRRHFGEPPSQTLGVRGWPGVQAMMRLLRE